MGLLIAGTTACGGPTSGAGPDGGAGPQATTGSTDGPTDGSNDGSSLGPTPTGEPAADTTPSANRPSKRATGPVPRLRAAQVVGRLAGAGYRCGRDSTYAVCTAGPVAVWVLTGSHKRPPVVSLHASGPADAAAAAIAKELPRALGLVRIQERARIADWFGQQTGKTVAQTTAGDWLVELSVEIGTDEPGAHLTLTDRLCKVNCQTE